MVVLRVTDNFGNKETLDIQQDGGLFCDISAIESGELGEIFGVSSKEFLIPGTPKNNKFFGNLYDLGATPSIALDHTIYASVLINGQEGFAGRMYINDIVKDDKGYVMYKAVVINEVVDFKTRIQNLALADLDFSAYNHFLTVANVTGSWTYDLHGGDIVYPLADYGSADQLDPPTTIARGSAGESTFNNEDHGLPVDCLLPAIRVRSVLDAIFSEVDYNYSSSFLDSSYFDRIYMLPPSNGSGKIVSGTRKTDNVKASYSGSIAQVVPAGTSADLVFPTEVYDPDNNYNPVTGQYTVPEDGKYDVGCYLDGMWASAPASGFFNSLAVRIQVNSTTVYSKVYYSPNQSYRPGFSFTTANLTAGDIINIEVYTFLRQTGTGNVSAGSDFSVLATNNGSYLTVRPNINAQVEVQLPNQFGPDLKVRDFLQGLIQKFNLVIEPKQDNLSTLIIEPFNTWRDSGVEKDWSDKVDHSVRKSVKGTMIDQAHVVNFKDEDDTDYLNKLTTDSYGKVFGEALFTDSSDLTEGVKGIGSFFAPTPMTAIKGTSEFTIPNLYEAPDGPDGDKKPFRFTPRILHYNGLREDTSVNAFDSAGNITGQGYYLKELDGTSRKVTQYGSMHYLELEFNDVDDFYPNQKTSRDLNFNNSQQYHFVNQWSQDNYYVERDAIYEYWSEYINELYSPDSRKFTCNLLFSPEELKDIQLNDKIFIDGHYYRIDNISNFNLTDTASTQVTFIKAPVRKFKYPLRRVYNIQGVSTGVTGSSGNDIGGSYTDLTVDPIGGLGLDGTVTYVNADTGLPPTGSGNQGIVGRVARLDQFEYIPNDSASAVWRSNPIQPTVPFRNQISQGNNVIDFTANNVNLQGSGNSVSHTTDIINVQGSANTIQSDTKFINVTGDDNTVESFAENSSIINSVNSKLTELTNFSTIIGGNDTIISGSTKSVAIGQDTITQGGNSNIVIGNFDTTTKTIKDMINTVVINPNRDIESRENLGAEDFSGRAYIGNYQDIGSRYSDNTTLTLSAGDTLYLTGSAYSSDAVYNVTWTGGDGTANVYLPEVDPNIASLAKGQGGYKRYLRFTTDGTLDAGKNVLVNVASGDYLNGQFNGLYNLDEAYQNFEIYGVESGNWRVLEASVPDLNNGAHTGAYGSFYSTQDQPIVTSGSAQLVTMNATFASNKTSLNGSAIEMEYNGAYSFIYTAKVTNAANEIHYADFWIKYNGVDYPNSTVRVSVPARKNSTTFTAMPVTVQLLDVAINDGDQVELYWRGDSTDLSLNYETFGGTIPAQPSVRAVIQAV